MGPVYHGLSAKEAAISLETRILDWEENRPIFTRTLLSPTAKPARLVAVAGPCLSLRRSG